MRRRWETEGAAMRRVEYISVLGKRMIVSCMRYWVVSIRLMLRPWRVRRRSKRVVSREGGSLLGFVGVALMSDLPLEFSGFLGLDEEAAFRSEAEDLIVGGSCKWSPARTTFFADRRGTQHCASRA